jgi:hypothetical protein
MERRLVVLRDDLATASEAPPTSRRFTPANPDDLSDAERRLAAIRSDLLGRA